MYLSDTRVTEKLRPKVILDPIEAVAVQEKADVPEDRVARFNPPPPFGGTACLIGKENHANSEIPHIPPGL